MVDVRRGRWWRCDEVRVHSYVAAQQEPGLTEKVYSIFGVYVLVLLSSC